MTNDSLLTKLSGDFNNACYINYNYLNGVIRYVTETKESPDNYWYLASAFVSSALASFCQNAVEMAKSNERVIPMPVKELLDIDDISVAVKALKNFGKGLADSFAYEVLKQAAQLPNNSQAADEQEAYFESMIILLQEVKGLLN